MNKNFDDNFLDNAQEEYVKGLDDRKKEEDFDIDKYGRKFSYKDGAANTVTYDIPADNNTQYYCNKNAVKGIALFYDNGRFANLNNLSIRSTTFNILRERLIKKFVEICKIDAEKQGKSRTHFCLFESALRWLTQYLDDENCIVGARNGRNIKLNSKQLKRLLASSDYELSEAQSTSLIKLAKKADILRQKGRGDTSYFIMNPIFNNGAYVGRISRKVLIEFNKNIKKLFSELQYRKCTDLLVDLNELSREELMENGDNE